MRDCCISCLTGPVAHHGIQAMGVGKTDRFECVSQRPYLVGFYEHAVGCVHLDALLNAVNLRHKDVITADKATVACLTGELRKCIKVIFMERVFHIHKIIAVNELSNVSDLVFWTSYLFAVLVSFPVLHLACSDIYTHID